MAAKRLVNRNTITAMGLRFVLHIQMFLAILFLAKGMSN